MCANLCKYDILLSISIGKLYRKVDQQYVICRDNDCGKIDANDAIHFSRIGIDPFYFHFIVPLFIKQS